MDYMTGRRYQQARATMQAEHEALQAEKEREEEERRAANDAARERYLAKLNAEKAEQQRRRDEQIKAELASQKTRIKREWLASHPMATEQDFERKAWPHLRANLLEERREEQIRKTAEQLRSTGMYGL